MTADVFKIFDKEWALLTAGDIGHFNTMTVSWGALGTLWGKPTATVYVKPIRYTHEFLDKNGVFTLSFFTEEYRRALLTLGTLSGRDTDKVKASGLTPKALDSAVTFEQAHMTLICKKIYRQDMDAAFMPADAVEAFYQTEAPHTMYIGEVTDIIGK